MGNYILGILSTLLIEVLVLAYVSKLRFDLVHIIGFILLMIICIPLKLSNLVMIIGGVLITYHQNRGRKSWLTYILFVMYAFTTTWILQVVLNFYGNKVCAWLNYNNYWGTVVCQGIVFLLQVGIVYWFKDSLVTLTLSRSRRKQKMEMIVIAFLAVYLIYGSTFNNEYNNWWIAAYVIGLLLFWSSVRASALLETRLELSELKDFELQNIEEYANKVETMYQDLRRFRHDYLNILLSMDQAIRSQDLELIEQTYNEVLAPSKEKLSADYYDFGKLKNIKTSAVKSILYNKFSYAMQKGIEVEIEINDDVAVQHTKLLDAIRILSILLDNAIEATLQSDHPHLLVAYIKDTNLERVIIENSISVERVAIAPLFKENYTTKKENEGQGLATVSRILNHYPNVTLKTSSHDYKFTQELVLNKGKK